MTDTSALRMSPHPTFQAPGIPADEPERLAALHGLGLLDTAPTESFDRITRLASKALRVPIVLFSLVDASRQWFKSCVGTDATGTSRELSFCGHVVFERRPLVVCDATLDPRFAGNPLVTGAPRIRAYLGIPLFAETLEAVGPQPIGTLCAIDVQPRAFRDADVVTLGELARILEDSIQARELVARLAAALRCGAPRARLQRPA